MFSIERKEEKETGRKHGAWSCYTHVFISPSCQDLGHTCPSAGHISQAACAEIQTKVWDSAPLATRPWCQPKL